MTERLRFTSALVCAFVGTCATSALAAGDPPPGAAVPPPVKAAAPRTDTPAPAPATTPAPAPAPAEAAAPPPAASAGAGPAGAKHEDDDDRDDEQPTAAPPTDTPVVLKTHEVSPHPATPEQPNPNSIDDGMMGSHQNHWLVSIGWREAFVSSSGLDPFSENNAVPQFSLSAGRTLFSSGNLSLVGLALWDIGGLESTARGAKTQLSVNRLTLGAEGRYHIFRRLYAFGRVAPGALNWTASLADGVTAINRTDSAWSFAGDLSAGAAFEFAGDNRGASTRPRAWVGFDGGYGWAGASKLDLKPEDGAGAPVRTQPLSFGELAVRGPFIRFSVSGTY